MGTNLVCTCESERELEYLVTASIGYILARAICLHIRHCLRPQRFDGWIAMLFWLELTMATFCWFSFMFSMLNACGQKLCGAIKTRFC